MIKTLATVVIALLLTTSISNVHAVSSKMDFLTSTVVRTDPIVTRDWYARKSLKRWMIKTLATVVIALLLTTSISNVHAVSSKMDFLTSTVVRTDPIVTRDWYVFSSSRSSSTFRKPPNQHQKPNTVSRIISIHITE